MLSNERVDGARAGSNPTVIGRMRSGWVVLGDSQFLAGYSLLLSDPVVESLNDLGAQQRSQFLLDMSRVGDALLAVTDAYRINYEILGNTDAFLHAHIFPRYRNEPSDRVTGPVWRYERSQFDSRLFEAERDRPLMRAVYETLEALNVVSQQGPSFGVGA